MDIQQRIKNAFAAFRKTKNDYDELGVVTDGNDYWRMGPRRTMQSGWSTPEISDKDFYTGFGFAVINKRANRSVTLGKNFLITDANQPTVDGANKKGTQITHPYLDIIRSSEDFAERDFWYNISTYLDLEGVYYLMAVRTVTKSGLVGNIQKFSLLNPYNIRPVIDKQGNLGGYVEQRENLTREIPKEMIIPIKLLNPFDPDRPFALADAARDSQFTLKQSNDYAREAINGNLNSPGIISTAIELPDDQFDNFVERVKNHGRGEPLFGNGAGTVSWVNMQTDLDKAALKDINTISRDSLLAVSGTSKTGMGVEDTGTGREVSRTQKDDFTENAVMPQVENIIDALNLDYRKYYQADWKKYGYSITLDNPLETDRESEKADVDIRDAEFALLQDLLAAGYSYDIASKYARGFLNITDIGEPPKPAPAPIDPTSPPRKSTEPDPAPGEQPTLPPKDPTPPPEPSLPAKPTPTSPTPPTKKAKNDYKDDKFDVYEGYPIPVVQYLDDLADHIIPVSEKGSFVYSTETMLQMNAAKKTVTIDRIEDKGNSLLAIVDETTFIKLGEFYNNADRVAILAKLNKRYHNQVVAIKKKIDLDHEDNVYEVIKNAAPFDKQAQIEGNTRDLQTSAAAVDNQVFEWYMTQISAGNNSPNLPSTQLQQFINSLTLPFAVYFTVMFPVYAAHHVTQTSKEQNLPDELPIIAITTEVKQLIDEFAKNEATSHINTIKTDIENALANIKSKTSDPTEIKAKLEEAFKQIQAQRSQTIANNAAARIFNISQYEADLQFLTRAGKLEHAYKVLFSLTGDPCPICAHIIAETNARPIPFTQAFVSLGDTIEAGGKKMTFDFEKITAGNVHPNCHCAYRLLIKD